MATLANQNKEGLTPEDQVALQNYIDKVRTGEIVPFEEKIERGRRILKKAGLIK